MCAAPRPRYGLYDSWQRGRQARASQPRNCDVREHLDRHHSAVCADGRSAAAAAAASAALFGNQCGADGCHRFVPVRMLLLLLSVFCFHATAQLRAECLRLVWLVGIEQARRQRNLSIQCDCQRSDGAIRMRKPSSSALLNFVSRLDHSSCPVASLLSSMRRASSSSSSLAARAAAFADFLSFSI